MKIKRIFSLTLAVLLLCTCFVFTDAFAAGASLSASSTSVTVGDTVRVSFSVSGSQLGGAQGTFTFSNTGIISAPSLSKGNSWSWDTSGNTFSAYGDIIGGSTTVAVVTFTAKAAGTVTVGVTGVEVTDEYDSVYPTAGSVTIKIKDKPAEPSSTKPPSSNPSSNSKPSGGNTSSAGSSSKPGQNTSSPASNAGSSAVSNPDTSGETALASLSIENAELSPAFAPEILSYTATAAEGTQTLDIKAVPKDSSAKVTVTGNQLSAGQTADITIVVTAENGENRTYSIKAAAGAEVLSSNNRLSSLEVDAGALSPAFDPETLNYVVWLPYETESLHMTAAAEDEKAQGAAIEGDGALKENEDTIIKVTSTAENGEARVYTVIAKRAILPQNDPSILALNPAATAEDAVARIQTLGKTYGAGKVTVSLQEISPTLLKTMKEYPGVELVFLFDGASLRLSGSDLFAMTGEESYPIRFEAPKEVAALSAKAGGDTAPFIFSFAGGTLPGNAQMTVKTSRTEGEAVNVYGYDAKTGQYLQLAEAIAVGKNGEVSYRAAFYGESMITSGQIAGAVLPGVSGSTGESTPLWMLLVGGGLLLLVGFGLGILVKAALVRRKKRRMEAGGAPYLSDSGLLQEASKGATPLPFVNHEEEPVGKPDPLWDTKFSEAPGADWEEEDSAPQKPKTSEAEEYRDSPDYDEPLFAASEIPFDSEEYFGPTEDEEAASEPSAPNKKTNRYR